MSLGKMTITESNVMKVISVMTGIYWVVVGLLLGSSYRSGSLFDVLVSKNGWGIVVVLFSGTCGMAFWAMLAPSFLRSLRSGSSGRGVRKWGERIWCFSSVPMVLFCFGILCLIVFYRMTGR